MNQEQLIEQAITELESAGFLREEIADQVAEQIITPSTSFEVSCYRKMDDRSFKVWATLATETEAETTAYKVQRISAFDPYIQPWEKERTVLRSADGDPIDVSFAIYNFMGGFERLRLELFIAGFSEIDKRSSWDVVRSTLSHLPYEAHVTGSAADVSGTADYSLILERLTGEYCLREYEMKFTALPLLAHGNYCDVDTLELETDMANIDWSDDTAILNSLEDDATFNETVQNILSRLDALSESIPGGYLGHILQLKYLQRSSVAEVLIHDEAWDTLARLPQTSAIFPIDVPLRRAFNLMAGRAVMLRHENFHPATAHTWQRLKGIAEDLTPTYVTIENYQWHKMFAEVRSIIPGEGKAAHSTSLLAGGDLLRIHTIQGNCLFLRADPDKRKVDLLTPDMNSLPHDAVFLAGKKAMDADHTSKITVQRFRSSNKKRSNGKGL